MDRMVNLPGRERFNRDFYYGQSEASLRSASVVVPQILSLMGSVASVVDLGCGTGVWLTQFKNAGVSRVLGIDWTTSAELSVLDSQEFLTADLTQPLELAEKFDLALSLAVAEHVPPSAEKTFVSNICNLSDAIVFCSAVPGQGAACDVNERWPSYWSALINAQGFDAYDVLRPTVWYDHRVDCRYAQNIIFFVRRRREDLRKKFSEHREKRNSEPLDLVHPRFFEQIRSNLEREQQRSATAAESFSEQIVDFRCEDLHTYLCDYSGVSHYESWGRWTDGPIARFEFRRQLPENFCLEIRGYPFGPNLKQSFVVSIGGACTKFRPNRVIAKSYKVILKNPQRSNELFIHVPTPRSPWSVGFSDDKRNLGFALTHLRLFQPSAFDVMRDVCAKLFSFRPRGSLGS